MIKIATTLSLLICGQLLARSAAAQINAPAAPQVQEFTPITGPANATGNAYQYQSPMPRVLMGATAQDIINQVNRGIPQYSNDPLRNQQINKAIIAERMRHDPAYNPALRNPNSGQYRINP